MKSRFIFFDASCMNRSLLRQINKRHFVRGNFFLEARIPNKFSSTQQVKFHAYMKCQLTISFYE